MVIIIIIMAIRRNVPMMKIRSIRQIRCAQSAKKLAALVSPIPATMTMNVVPKVIQEERMVEKNNERKQDDLDSDGSMSST